MIVGMRRNGTTIMFDGFVQDPRVTAFYEPLNLIGDAALLGGGSGVHQVDLYAPLRPIREAFLAANPDVHPEELNHGGPTRASVEVTSGLPELIEQYLDAVFAAPGPKVIKFVRMSAKIADLHRRAPDNALVWTVRDPRAVARSYLHGRNGKFADRYAHSDDWFGATTPGFNRWSVGVLSDAVLGRTSRQTDDPPTDVERVLLVWKHMVQTMAIEAPQYFAGSNLCIRHEDFCEDPVGSMTALYQLAELDADPGVCEWLEHTVTPVPVPPFLDDGRWQQTFERLEMTDLVSSLGYE